MRALKARLHFCSLVLLSPTACLAAAPTNSPSAPDNWRYLASNDAPVDPERVSLSMLRAEADFDGDGRLDQAAVLLRKSDSNEAGVFVFLSGNGSATPAEQVDGYQLTTGEFQLSVVKPGCYRSETTTVCLGNAGLMRSEIEYGWGTLCWLQNGKWRQLRLTRGEYDGL